MISRIIVATAALALGAASAVQAQVHTSQGYAGQAYSGQSYGTQSYGYSSSQTYSSQGHGYGQGHPSSYDRSCGSSCDRRHDRGPRRPYAFNGQQDVPGDFRCDAYWDRGRTDCDARWRDQRQYRGTPRRSYSTSRPSYGGPAVYQGEYGRPDVVYSGGYSYGQTYADPHGHNHGGYAQYGRDPQRINWCCAEYRSYDPATGYYTAYSGQRIFCG